MRVLVHHDMPSARASWLTLQEQGDCWPFQAYDLLAAWLATVGAAQGVKPVVVECRDDQGPILVAPLGLRRRKGLAVLEFLGGLVCDYHAPLLAPDAAKRLTTTSAQELIQLLAAQAPKADLLHLRHQSSHVRDQVNPMYLPALAGREQISRQAALGRESFEQFALRVASKSMRQDSRRQWRRIAEVGEASFCVHEDPAQQAERIENMIRFKQARYAETGVTDLLALPGFADFYRRFPQFGAPATAHVSSLAVEGELVAVHVGLVDRGRYFYLMPAWQGGTWRKYSVGRLHMELLMDHCLKQGLQCFDFTIGDEDYKSKWSSHTMTLGETIQGTSLLGRAACRALSLAHGIKQRRAQKACDAHV